MCAVAPGGARCCRQSCLTGFPALACVLQELLSDENGYWRRRMEMEQREAEMALAETAAQEEHEVGMASVV